MSIFDDFFDFIRDDDLFDEDEFDFGTAQVLCDQV